MRAAAALAMAAAICTRKRENREPRSWVKVSTIPETKKARCWEMAGKGENSSKQQLPSSRTSPTRAWHYFLVKTNSLFTRTLKKNDKTVSHAFLCQHRRNRSRLWPVLSWSRSRSRTISRVPQYELLINYLSTLWHFLSLWAAATELDDETLMMSMTVGSPHKVKISPIFFNRIFILHCPHQYSDVCGSSQCTLPDYSRCLTPSVVRTPWLKVLDTAMQSLCTIHSLYSIPNHYCGASLRNHFRRPGKNKKLEQNLNQPFGELYEKWSTTMEFGNKIKNWSGDL
jgi:hypothetical protein